MTARHLAPFALLLATLAAAPAFAQRTPESVTPAEIGQLQTSIEQNCVKTGDDKNAPHKDSHESCTCATEVLKVKMSNQEWKTAVAAAFNGDKDTATKIIARHQEDVKVCKPQ